MQMRARSKAKCLRAIDGDTLLVELTCPCCKIVSQQRVRLARLDAPELKGPNRHAAQAAKHYLAAIVDGQEIEVMVVRAWPDKYGRVLAEVYHGGQCLTDVMVSAAGCEYYSPNGLAMRRGIDLHQAMQRDGAIK